MANPISIQDFVAKNAETVRSIAQLWRLTPELAFKILDSSLAYSLRERELRLSELVTLGTQTPKEGPGPLGSVALDAWLAEHADDTDKTDGGEQ